MCTPADWVCTRTCFYFVQYQRPLTRTITVDFGVARILRRMDLQHIRSATRARWRNFQLQRQGLVQDTTYQKYRLTFLNCMWKNKCKSECTKHIQSLHAAAVALHLGGSNVSHKAETGHWGRYCWGFSASRNSGINRSKQEEQGGIQGRNESNEARLRSPWWKNAFIVYLVTGRTPARFCSVDCAGLVRSKGSRCRDCCPIVFLRFSASLPHIFIPVSSSDDDVFLGTGGSVQSASAGTMFQMRTSSSGCRFYSRPQCSPRIFPS